MSHLFLADLKEHSPESIKRLIILNYKDEYKNPITQHLESILEEYDVIVAYEHVGSWGCDSASWFLLKHKESKEYFEFSGSHCSCHGFEGQFDLEETSLKYLQSNKFGFCGGGYDDDYASHKAQVKEFLLTL